jgi:hypothetical protein
MEHPAFALNVLDTSVFDANLLDEEPFDADDQELAFTISEDQLSIFSIVLRQALGNNHAQIVRVAKELNIAENTIYRWMNGRSEPRSMHLIGLLEVLPEARTNLIFAINKTFPGVLALTPHTITFELNREVVRTLIEMTAAYPSHETVLEKAQDYIFHHAFLLFGAPHRGLCVTYAELMPPQHDGRIHTLREAKVEGTFPWAPEYPLKAFYGSATLVGRAASTLRASTWDDIGPEDRLLVEIDESERSACAYPVMRRGGLAGVFMISTNETDLFRDLYACEAVTDLAHLYSLTLPISAFTSPKLLDLHPLPGLARQRDVINTQYQQRLTIYTNLGLMAREESEVQVLKDLELELERIGKERLEEKLQASKRTLEV